MLVWDAPYLGIEAGERTPNAARYRLRCSAQGGFEAVDQVEHRERLGQEAIAPACSARARMPSSGNAVIKINGTS